MTRLLSAYCIVFIFLALSCKKDGFTSSPGARLISTVDTLRFDTVFTSVGSVTRQFTLVNDNGSKLLISGLKLGGGTASPFKINVNGTAGTAFTNVELNANDSLYVFVKVFVDPNIATNPFVLMDSLEITYNGNVAKVYLQAFGQNARFIKGQTINANTTWNNTLPYVIQNDFVVAAGATLTIEKGTRIYVNARAAFVVNGNLLIQGEKAAVDHVVFKSDRLDADYKDLPGGWPGIVFTASSQQNEMVYADILNAYQALVVVGGGNLPQVKLQLQQCNISNAYDIGIYGLNANIAAANCLVSQCGNGSKPGIGGSNLLLTAGGKYNFTHCTIATYANYYQDHKQPVCYISNTNAGVTGSLQAAFTNCIIYGQGGSGEDELLVAKAAGDAVIFANCIYKVKDNDPAGVTFTDCLRNTNPQFDSIGISRQEYNFRLKDVSPAIDAAKNSAISLDLDGNTRPAGLKPDIGCYEKQ